MKYNREIGKIYDTIFFLIEYFNPKEVENGYTKVFDDTNFMIDCYRQVKSKIDKIPDYLSPLFYSKDGTASSISTFFSEKIDYQKDNIDSFIVKITTQSDFLYKCICQYIFGDNNDFTSANCINSIKEIDAPTDFKLHLALLFGNFTYIISELALLLKNVYLSINELHQKYEKELLTRFNQIKSDSNLQLYQNTIKYDRSEFDTTTISISLINQYTIYGPCRESNNTFLMLGYKHEESLNDYFNDFNISIDQFIVSCGNELRLNIIRTISAHNELTSSQLAQILECPVTTMIRHIELLSFNNIIYISKRQGLQIFYSLNKKLFRKMKVELNRIFEKIEEN